MRLWQLLLCGLILNSSLWAAETPVPESKPAPAPISSGPEKSIRVPAIKFIKDIRNAYTSMAQPHLLIILHLPKAGGTGYIEVHNKTKTDIAIVQFTVHALGHEGELEYEDLPASWSAVKEVKITNLRELAIRSPRVYNKDASEIFPALVIHQTDLQGKKLDIGKKKVE